jgi:hypothetical protein
MSVLIPYVALSILIALSLGARPVAAVATARRRTFMTGVVSAWVLGSLWIFG